MPSQGLPRDAAEHVLLALLSNGRIRERNYVISYLRGCYRGSNKKSFTVKSGVNKKQKPKIPDVFFQLRTKQRFMIALN